MMLLKKKGYKIQHYEKGDIIGNDNLGYWEIQVMYLNSIIH